jgi:hypothetical protein
MRPIYKSAVLVASLGVSLITQLATAQVVPTPDTTPEAPSAAVSKVKSHLHDSFYLRLALGGGYVSDKISNDIIGKLSIHGAAVPLEVAAGWAVIDGLSLGAGIWLTPLVGPTGEYRGSATAIPS